MSKVAFYTLGCKVNQYETEVMKELFKKEGYDEVEFNESADVYVINTCTVTNLGDRKSRQMIRKAKKSNEDSIVAVVGCYSQVSPDEIEKIEGVNIIAGTKDRTNIVNLVKKYIQDNERINEVKDIMSNKEFEDMSLGSYSDKTRAFIKIQEGCNQFCSYCIIPYARGPIRSKKQEDVIKEVKNLSQNGFKEIVLTGIHLTSYGMDNKSTDLLKVIKEIHKIEKIERIRLGSLEPLYINEEFIREASKLKKLCPHYHLSLQSGCDETLKRMNRNYTTDEYKEIVENLRKNIPDVSITTDIMVGFPGETDEEFNKTAAFVKDIEFTQIHVFKYSKRKGTKAAEMKEQISPHVKEERSKRLIAIGEELENNFLKKHINTKQSVLFEQEVKKNIYEGHTPNYIRVHAKSTEDISNEVRMVEINEIDKNFVKGRIV